MIIEYDLDLTIWKPIFDKYGYDICPNPNPTDSRFPHIDIRKKHIFSNLVFRIVYDCRDDINWCVYSEELKDWRGSYKSFEELFLKVIQPYLLKNE